MSVLLLFFLSFLDVRLSLSLCFPFLSRLACLCSVSNGDFPVTRRVWCHHVWAIGPLTSLMSLADCGWIDGYMNDDTHVFMPSVLRPCVMTSDFRESGSGQVRVRTDTGV